MSDAEREAAERSQSVMQGLQGMATGASSSSLSVSSIGRPDSRASTHDHDGLPPRKKQAVESGSGSRGSSPLGSRSGSAALPSRMQSGLRVSTPNGSEGEDVEMVGSSTPGFGSSAGPQRVSLTRAGSNGAASSPPTFQAAVITPNRTQRPGTGFSTSRTNDTGLNPERLQHVFPKVPFAVIEETIIQYGDEPNVEILRRLRAANDGVPYRAPGVASVKTIKPIATRAPIPFNTSGNNGESSPAFTSPVQPATQRKNPKMVSAIYANRSERRPTQAAIDVDASSPVRGDADGKQQQPRTTVISDEEAVTEDDDSDTEGGRKGKGKMQVDEDGQDMDEVKALEVFNTCTAETLTGTIGELHERSLRDCANMQLVCSAEQAEIIISLRPFTTVEELRKKLTKKKGVSFGLFEQYIEVIQGYIEVDRCLTKCENIGKEIAEIVEIWTGSSRDSRSRTGTPDVGSTAGGQDTGLHVTSVDVSKIKAEIVTEQDKKRRGVLKSFVTEQPKSLADGVVLKDYQLLGVNWLNLLYSKDLSCILADDMGRFVAARRCSLLMDSCRTGQDDAGDILLDVAARKGKQGPASHHRPVSGLMQFK